MPSVCLSVYMNLGMDVPSLVFERLDGFCSYSVVKSLSIIGRCPMNTNIRAPKLGLFTWAIDSKMTISSKTSLAVVIKFQ
jgi:hypothetical protein